MSSWPNAWDCLHRPACDGQSPEREGYIETYRAMLGRKRVGLGLSVFVGVKIEGHADERAIAFEEAVVAFPEVIAFT